jgi:cell division protein FtsZ
VADVAHPDANIIFGAMVDEKVEDEVWITVVATGYGEQPSLHERPRSGRRERSAPAEPARIPADREPRVRRAARSNGLGDVDVPEFLPRG